MLTRKKMMLYIIDCPIEDNFYPRFLTIRASTNMYLKKYIQVARLLPTQPFSCFTIKWALTISKKDFGNCKDLCPRKRLSASMQPTLRKACNKEQSINMYYNVKRHFIDTFAVSIYNNVKRYMIGYLNNFKIPANVLNLIL